MNINEFMDALQKAYQRAGTQSKLAQMTGISQGRIADYLNARYSLANMTIGTMLKIFPDIQIDFFGENGKNKEDYLRNQLLEIFDSLNIKEQIKLITIVAANFGEEIKRNTRSRDIQ